MMKRSRETTGTARRAPRRMDGRGTVFELADELPQSATRPRVHLRDRAAKTLAKTDGLGVTLVLLKRNASFHPEGATGGATLHVLEGQIRVQTDGDHWNVGPAAVIVLGENLREPVTALEEAVFLVTVAWPAGAGASPQEAAQAERERRSETAAFLVQLAGDRSAEPRTIVSSRGLRASVLLARCWLNAASNLVNGYSPGQGFASGSAEATRLVDPSRHFKARTMHGRSRKRQRQREIEEEAESRETGCASARTTAPGFRCAEARLVIGRGEPQRHGQVVRVPLGLACDPAVDGRTSE